METPGHTPEGISILVFDLAKSHGFSPSPELVEEPIGNAAATYAFAWGLANEWRFDAAVRYVLADSTEGLFDKWLPSAVLRMPVTERWEVHAEWFGSWSVGLDDEKVRPFVGIPDGGHRGEVSCGPRAALRPAVCRGRGRTPSVLALGRRLPARGRPSASRDSREGCLRCLPRCGFDWLGRSPAWPQS